jgi:hypothetical protein
MIIEGMNLGMHTVSSEAVSGKRSQMGSSKIPNLYLVRNKILLSS